jgi:hypothetical protein
VEAALDAPYDAIEAAMAGQWIFPMSVIAGVKAVYPQVYAQMQREMSENAERIYERQPRDTSAFWSRLFEVPLSPQALPAYTLPAEPTPEAQPQPQFGQPSAVSSIAAAAETRGRLDRG